MRDGQLLEASLTIDLEDRVLESLEQGMVPCEAPRAFVILSRIDTKSIMWTNLERRDGPPFSPAVQPPLM